MIFPPLIDVQQVTYAYPLQNAKKATNPVLHKVSFQVQQGEYIALLGHNGSGKSTLARLCNALLIPQEGHVFINGIDSRDEQKRRVVRDTIGIIFQNPDNQIIATIV